MFLKTIFIVAIAAFSNLAALPSIAQDTKLESLDTWGSNRGWEGVGFLKIEGKSSCTGVLIRPDLVLTAGHCLYDSKSGERKDPTKIEFRAGWRDGKFVARRFGKSSIVHPKFLSQEGEDLSIDRIRNDVALLVLHDPIQSTHADPFKTDTRAVANSEVSVVSYGQGRNDAASRQRSCRVLESSGGVVAMSCDVVPGSSGAPVFAMRDGHPRVVSVVSGLGEMAGKQVSFGMDLSKPLSKLLADLGAGRGVYPNKPVVSRRITVGKKRNDTGARFLRP